MTKNSCNFFYPISEEEDQPMITGFAEDEPLVIA